MRISFNFLTRIYGWSLQLYPAAFRKSFAAEMSEVFQSAAEDASTEGDSTLLGLCLREVWEYPINLFRQYWIQFTKQELIMTTELTTSENKICPRCQHSTQPEANYCINCGRPFIPFKQHLKEMSRTFFNANLLIRIVGGLIFVILSGIAADRILFHGFHPATNMIVLSGTAVLSFLAGWRLFGDVSNFKKLRFLVFIAVIALSFFVLSSDLDELYLRKTVTAGNPLTYQFLNSETYVAYVEEKQAFYTNQHLTQKSWMQMYLYFPPFDEYGIDGLALKPPPPTLPTQLSEIVMADNHPALAIERSWTNDNYYLLFSMLIIAAGVSAGFFTTKRRGTRSLALAI